MRDNVCIGLYKDYIVYFLQQICEFDGFNAVVCHQVNAVEVEEE